MKVVLQLRYGRASDVLNLAEVDEPSMLPHEVLVQVRAVGVSKGSWLITQGLPYIARPSYGLRVPKHRVAGLEFAGTVSAIGQNVTELELGQSVFGFHKGALAECLAVSQTDIVPVPTGVSLEQAATVPISGIAALQAIRDCGRVHAGQHVLVIGASGGVGSFAVQIAKAFGARVTGVASTSSLSLVRELGADYVVDYTREDPTTSRRRYDVIIDVAGNRPVSRLRRALHAGGTLVLVGGTGGPWTMGFQRTVGALFLAPFVGHRIKALLSTPNQTDLIALARLIEAGHVKPAVDTTYPLSRAGDVIESVGRGHARGSSVITL